MKLIVVILKRIVRNIYAIWCYISDPQFRKVKKSGFFSPAYYRATNPNLEGTYTPLLTHYLQSGWLAGKAPHKLFSPQFYIEQCPQAAHTGETPLLHYLDHGWREKIAPSRHFIPTYYLQQKPELPTSIGEPLRHYLCIGQRDGRKPNPFFDPKYYALKYPDIAQSTLEPLEHYLLVGIPENRQPDPFFNIAWYLDRTPILKQYTHDYIYHYAEYGWKEGKSPLPLFDPTYYKQENLDIKKGVDPYLHYLNVGLDEDRRPCAWFDPKFYKNTYLDVDQSSLPALRHYLEIGIYEGRYTEEKIKTLLNKPLISVVVPVYNVNEHYLNSCIRSVLYQSYPHWELCLTDDGSSDQHIRPTLKKWASLDQRIKVNFLAENSGIAAATNQAIAQSSGEYIAFLDNDDELAFDCLYEVVKTINDQGADLIYTDEDLIGDDHSRLSIFYKPKFNKALLLCHNYITHLVVTRRSLLNSVNRLSCKYNGAQDFDLFLKLSEKAQIIFHISKILYHWRASESSTNINHQQKKYANEAGRLALVATLKRRKIDGKVELTEQNFYYRVRRYLAKKPLVSIIVGYSEASKTFAAWQNRLLSCAGYNNSELIVASRPTNKAETPGGLATSYNKAAAQASGEYIVFIDSRVDIQSNDWLTTLLELVTDKQAGVGGGLLRAAMGKEEISTVLPDLTNTASTNYNAFIQGCSSHANGLHCSQNVVAVSWRFCIISKTLFEINNGFDATNFPWLMADTDLCFKLHQSGFENLYTPHCSGQFTLGYESLIDGITNQSLDNERNLFHSKWYNFLVEGDPYYNRGIIQSAGLQEEAFLKWYAG